MLVGMGVGIVPTLCGGFARKRRRERREAAIKEEQAQFAEVTNSQSFMSTPRAEAEAEGGAAGGK